MLPKYEADSSMATKSGEWSKVPSDSRRMRPLGSDGSTEQHEDRELRHSLDPATTKSRGRIPVGGIQILRTNTLLWRRD